MRWITTQHTYAGRIKIGFVFFVKKLQVNQTRTFIYISRRVYLNLKKGSLIV